MFVCGLQESEFPLPGAGEPFLSDERRRELALASGLRLRPREDALAGERYLFYAAVSRATERLFLSYRSSDEEGNLALPSPFVADVADLLDRGWRDAGAGGCSPTSSGTRERRPHRARGGRAQVAARRFRWPVAAAGAGRGRSAPRRLGHVRHRESCPPGRSSPTPTARSSGWSTRS